MVLIGHCTFTMFLVLFWICDSFSDICIFSHQSLQYYYLLAHRFVDLHKVNKFTHFSKTHIKSWNSLTVFFALNRSTNYTLFSCVLFLLMVFCGCSPILARGEIHKLFQDSIKTNTSSIFLLNFSIFQSICNTPISCHYQVNLELPSEVFLLWHIVENN